MPIRDPRPQGTLEELREAGLNPLEWGSCAAQVYGEVMGCPFHSRNRQGKGGGCPWRDRPKYGAIQVLQINDKGMGAERKVLVTCFDYLLMKPQIESNNGVVKWIADEGEVVMLRGTKPLPIQPGQAVAVHEDCEHETIVPPYPKVREKFAMTARVMEARVKRIEEKRERQEDFILGIEPDLVDPKTEAVTPDATS